MLSGEKTMHDWTELHNIVVVCGHAVYCGGPRLTPARAAASDEHWLLQPFQNGEGCHYVSHIRAGVEIAAEDNRSLLLFSGGQTRVSSLLSEAQGYHDIATTFNFWGHLGVQDRCTTEEFARDSIDNLLFSIARFAECVGRIPERVTIVSWAFKEARITHHATALRWPSSRLNFVGVGAPSDLKAAEVAEMKTLSNFQVDASGYGTDGAQLGTKKMQRNPHKRQHGYAASCPYLAQVLSWRGKSRVAETDVLWS